MDFRRKLFEAETRLEQWVEQSIPKDRRSQVLRALRKTAGLIRNMRDSRFDRKNPNVDRDRDRAASLGIDVQTHLPKKQLVGPKKPAPDAATIIGRVLEKFGVEVPTIEIEWLIKILRDFSSLQEAYRNTSSKFDVVWDDAKANAFRSQVQLWFHRLEKYNQEAVRKRGSFIVYLKAKVKNQQEGHDVANTSDVIFNVVGRNELVDGYVDIYARFNRGRFDPRSNKNKDREQRVKPDKTVPDDNVDFSAAHNHGYSERNFVPAADNHRRNIKIATAYLGRNDKKQPTVKVAYTDTSQTAQFDIDDRTKNMINRGLKVRGYQLEVIEPYERLEAELNLDGKTNKTLHADESDLDAEVERTNKNKDFLEAIVLYNEDAKFSPSDGVLKAFQMTKGKLSMFDYPQRRPSLELQFTRVMQIETTSNGNNVIRAYIVKMFIHEESQKGSSRRVCMSANIVLKNNSEGYVFSVTNIDFISPYDSIEINSSSTSLLNMLRNSLFAYEFLKQIALVVRINPKQRGLKMQIEPIVRENYNDWVLRPIFPRNDIELWKCYNENFIKDLVRTIRKHPTGINNFDDEEDVV